MNILGTKYKVKYVNRTDIDFLDRYGDIDFYKKVIRVIDNEFKTDTLIHELAHGYLFELGFEEKAQDEDTVNVITNIVIWIMKALGKYE